MAISEQETGKVRASLRLSRLRALARSRDGSAAIEFALLAIPYFVVIFAILETFIAFAAEELVSNAVDTMSRQMRTGQITFIDSTRSTYKTQAQFRQAFCDEISIIMRCSATEAATPSKLYLDVQSFTAFGSIPTSIPRTSADKYSDLKISDFKFTPGGPGSINMVRAYYRWPITVDLVRPYVTGLRPVGSSMPSEYLIVATAAFQNEQYP
ncbi:Flp pilus assembly protein TadG [Rhizobium sp. BK650]|uniref:TadE/TadG family type IV pilus assembly protein n=1 Tax=Rhizobium sp. BK650 TaxID=2586990 RepID=UPI00161FCE5E|nr:TadE/TadG family type IV pilus assembly protein [Rhizobium sp. BK650]MBB3655837.1 Flp pilus assembly protein TadG [Rhizobium sp. BK650]